MFGPGSPTLFNYQNREKLNNLISELIKNWYPTPYNLIKELILQNSKPGQLVWDPACGMGTTGLAGIELKRRVILSDISVAATFYSRLLFSNFEVQKVKEQSRKMIRNWNKNLQFLSLFEVETFKVALPFDKKFQSLFRRGLKKTGSLISPRFKDLIFFLNREIQKVNDNDCRLIFQGALLLSIYKWARLQYDFGRNKYYFYNKVAKNETGLEDFMACIDEILQKKSIIKEVLPGENWLPEIYQQSFFCPLAVKDKVDYIILHWPESSFSMKTHFFIEETFLGKRTSKELVYNFSLPGRLKLKDACQKFMKNACKALKENRKLTIICEPNLPLVSCLFQSGVEAGLTISREKVKLVEVPGEGKKYLTLTFSKRIKNQLVLGTLNRLKKQSLFDCEASLIRQIKNFLIEKGGATREEIRNYLLTQHFYTLQVEKTLDELLNENFTSVSGIWMYNPKELQKSPENYLLRRISDVVSEIVYLLLYHKENYLTFSNLVWKLQRISQRFLYSTAFFHPLDRLKEEQGFNTMGEVLLYLLRKSRKRPDEDIERVLKRLLRKSSLFRIIEGEYIVISNWGSQKLFPVLIKIIESKRETGDQKGAGQFAEKALKLLPEAGLEERSTKRLEMYLKELINSSTEEEW